MSVYAFDTHDAQCEQGTSNMTLTEKDRQFCGCEDRADMLEATHTQDIVSKFNRGELR